MTELISWTADDFADAFQRHLPTGAVWPRDPGTTQRATIKSLMPTYQRSWALACDLPAETLPATTLALLPEWEASLGLPDPCAGPDPTIAQRQAHVVARLTQSTGPSLPSLIGFAAALGYAITIQEYKPCLADDAVADDCCNEPEWAHLWQVTYAGVTIDYAEADVTYADEMVETSGNAALECELRRLSPAHTVLWFAYTGSLEAGGWDQAPGWDSSGWAA